VICLISSDTKAQIYLENWSCNFNLMNQNMYIKLIGGCMQ
jgi:hypothetical protein